MPIIETRNLTKQFGTGDLAVEVLKGVNLSIEPGRIRRSRWGLAGPEEVP
jgi:ABC-type multidrug transport system ATPase subunit